MIGIAISRVVMGNALLLYRLPYGHRQVHVKMPSKSWCSEVPAAQLIAQLTLWHCRYGSGKRAVDREII
jgi:hypothetical protein